MQLQAQHAPTDDQRDRDQRFSTVLSTFSRLFLVDVTLAWKLFTQVRLVAKFRCPLSALPICALDTVPLALSLRQQPVVRTCLSSCRFSPQPFASLSLVRSNVPRLSVSLSLASLPSGSPFRLPPTTTLSTVPSAIEIELHSLHTAAIRLPASFDITAPAAFWAYSLSISRQNGNNHLNQAKCHHPYTRLQCSIWINWNSIWINCLIVPLPHHRTNQLSSFHVFSHSLHAFYSPTNRQRLCMSLLMSLTKVFRDLWSLSRHWSIYPPRWWEIVTVPYYPKLCLCHMQCQHWHGPPAHRPYLMAGLETISSSLTPNRLTLCPSRLHC